MRITTLALAMAGLLVAVPASAYDPVLVVDDNLVPCIPGQLPIHQTISDAVASARGGETIVVCPGTYVEAVQLFGDKGGGIALLAQGHVELVGPPGNQDHGVSILSAFFVTIQGFDISGFGRSGVYASHADGVAVLNNRVHNNSDGISLWFTYDARVINNEVEAGWWGIGLLYVDTFQVSGNRVVDNRYGIFAAECNLRPTIEYNVIIGSEQGIVVGPLYWDPYDENPFACDPVIRHNRLQGRGATAGGVGIWLLEKAGRGAVVTKNQVESFGAGFVSFGSLDVHNDLREVTFNHFRSNGIGIDLWRSDRMTLTNNHVSRSTIVDCRWDGYGINDLSNNQCRTEEPPGTFD